METDEMMGIIFGILGAWFCILCCATASVVLMTVCVHVCICALLLGAPLSLLPCSGPAAAAVATVKRIWHSPESDNQPKQSSLAVVIHRLAEGPKPVVPLPAAAPDVERGTPNEAKNTAMEDEPEAVPTSMWLR